MQMAKHNFRLISGLAELTRETNITAEMQLVANWVEICLSSEQCSLYCRPLLGTILNYEKKIIIKHDTLSITAKTFFIKSK